jgi:hypothetical protein
MSPAVGHHSQAVIHHSNGHFNAGNDAGFADVSYIEASTEADLIALGAPVVDFDPTDFTSSPPLDPNDFVVLSDGTQLLQTQDVHALAATTTTQGMIMMDPNTAVGFDHGNHLHHHQNFDPNMMDMNNMGMNNQTFDPNTMYMMNTGMDMNNQNFDPNVMNMNMNTGMNMNHAGMDMNHMNIMDMNHGFSLDGNFPGLQENQPFDAQEWGF